MSPLTLTISVGGGRASDRDNLLSSLRELVASSGADFAVRAPGGTDPAVRLHGDPALEPPLEQALDHALQQALDDEHRVVLLDPKPRAAFRDGELLDLSRLEYDLLLFFAENPRQVFTRAQLLSRVWGHVHTGVRTVDVHISRLRTKLDDPDLITTVYGVGYRLADNAPVRLVSAAT